MAVERRVPGCFGADCNRLLFRSPAFLSAHPPCIRLTIGRPIGDLDQLLSFGGYLLQRFLSALERRSLFERGEGLLSLLHCLLHLHVEVRLLSLSLLVFERPHPVDSFRCRLLTDVSLKVGQFSVKASFRLLYSRQEGSKL